jgi:phosphoribosylformimino-5-aminoimidazole carboxamide ribotide isomerase
MEILPSIDLREGKVVRLAQGDYARQTTYSAQPVQVAETFAAAGSRWIHVVDLDAALTGRQLNFQAVAEIAAAVELKIELGGGIRTDDAVRRAMEVGVDRVVIGSAALENWAWFEGLLGREDLAGRLALGLDARDGKLTKHGWTEQVELTAVEVARRVAGTPLAAIVYTDILRDGLLGGPNIAATAEVIAATDVGVIASGGMSTVADVAHCRRIGCIGAIIGRAYYEGRIDLAEALIAARG